MVLSTLLRRSIPRPPSNHSISSTLCPRHPVSPATEPPFERWVKESETEKDGREREARWCCFPPNRTAKGKRRESYLRLSFSFSSLPPLSLSLLLFYSILTLYLSLSLAFSVAYTPSSPPSFHDLFSSTHILWHTGKFMQSITDPATRPSRMEYHEHEGNSLSKTVASFCLARYGRSSEIFHSLGA